MRPGLLIFCLFLAGCGQKPLPVLGDVPAFQLTDHLGRTFSSSTLDGHVWVADFVFTNCEGPCPRMSSHMRSLQSKTDAAVRLISFTVDPARDTPQVLAEYANKFGNDSNRWLLLTGEVATLNMLDQDAFKLGSIGAEIEHSTRFALVDKKGHIRGYYGLSDGNPEDKIAKDVARLEKESS
jgi:cytochrome oxidase Cu insertion factor (SCO1/SenC/PrrC family)